MKEVISRVRIPAVAATAALAIAGIGFAAVPASAVSVAQVGNSSVIAAEVAGSLRFYWQAIGTKPWHAEVVAGQARRSRRRRWRRWGSRR
jgi:hypothetical protein